jgi:hypothetical protein
MKTLRAARTIVFVLFFLVLATNPMLANAGTPFLFTGVLHLLLGNVFVGGIEGLFVRKVFKVPADYGFIIMGNFASMFVGYVVAGMFVGPIYGAVGESSVATIPFLMGLMFIASVFIEWPFFGWALKEKVRSLSKTTLKYTFYAQCVSYAMLIPLYLFVESATQSQWTPRDAMINDLNNLAAQAYQYRIRPVSMGGGGGSYEKYSISGKYAVTESGRFSAVATKDSIAFTGVSAVYSNATMTVVVDSVGRLHSWKYTGDFQQAP